MSEESANKEAANNPANRTEYMRELMRKKRAEKKAAEVSAGSQRGSEIGALEGVVVGSGEVPGMTFTDKKFEEAIPDYFIYGMEIRSRNCWKCGERFETRLEMNKFCSPRCKEGWLTEAFGKLRQNEKST